MEIEEIKKTLNTPISKAGKRSDSYEKRIKNINSIESLQRKELKFAEKERLLLVHTTSLKEKVFIQYPGKESAEKDKKGKDRKKTAIRPWDFRPRLYLPNSNLHFDMSFANIWAVIFEKAEHLQQEGKEELLRILATLLYRMAFFHDHTLTKDFKVEAKSVSYEKNESTIKDNGDVVFSEIYKYEPNNEIIKYLAEETSEWGQMSLEGFLFYNEFLIWNEDCKYYFRNMHVQTKNQWIASTGRVNTILTHIRIIGYLLGELPLANIFDDFAKQRGISPASEDEILKICKGYVHK